MCNLRIKGHCVRAFDVGNFKSAFGDSETFFDDGVSSSAVIIGIYPTVSVGLAVSLFTQKFVPWI